MMGYVRAIKSASRGYALRRAGWDEGEFIRGNSDGDIMVRRRKARGGWRLRVYWPTHDDMFASDWELML